MADGASPEPDTAAIVESWLSAQPELETERTEEGGWMTVLAGEHKRTIPVHLTLSPRHLVVQSFFMRAPDENEGDVYAFLLRRNTRTYLCRFALYETGDVMLVGLLPRAAVTPGELDTLLGQVLAAADEAYDQALRLGFASYIEREQVWRASVGAPRNPIS